ncbi:MAG: glycosyltransferase [candidate division WWE3 bacterium]|nr:glycosyltransferase [candidate division WWE3 bacterium]
MKVSIISTVLNEDKYLFDFLDSLFSQTLVPDEVVICDGGSIDTTLEKLQIYAKKQPKLKIVTAPGSNISGGRNAAISAATGDIIAATDAGTRVAPDWLEKLVSSFTSPTDVAAGFFAPIADTTFEKSLAAVTVPVASEIEPEKFLPSSRSVAFYKSAWEAVRGYPEWLPICEDLVFDLKLKKAGFKFNFVPEAKAYWRPRQTLKKFFRQYFMYARGDGHAKLWWRRHLIRYLAYINGLLILSMLFSHSIMWLLPFFIGAAGYMSKFYNRFLIHFPGQPLKITSIAFSYIPVMVFIGDVAKMLGYPWGNYQRVAGKIKYEPYQ